MQFPICLTNKPRLLLDVGRGEPMDGSQIDEDLDEPTMGEKLASLNLLENKEAKSREEKESSQLSKPPSADSVHVLLKQALHADDQALIVNCLFTQNQKVLLFTLSLVAYLVGLNVIVYPNTRLFIFLAGDFKLGLNVKSI